MVEDESWNRGKRMLERKSGWAKEQTYSTEIYCRSRPARKSPSGQEPDRKPGKMQKDNKEWKTFTYDFGNWHNEFELSLIKPQGPGDCSLLLQYDDNVCWRIKIRFGRHRARLTFVTHFNLTRPVCGEYNGLPLLCAEQACPDRRLQR